MTPAALAALKALAEGATPGKWKDGAQCVYVDTGHAAGDPDAPDTRIAHCDDHDARYIAAASPDVVLALVDRLERVEAQEAVRGGEWCARNRAEGRGPCGACAWCCKQASDDAERLRLAVAAYLKARDAWGYTMGAINGEAQAADGLRAALRGEP